MLRAAAMLLLAAVMQVAPCQRLKPVVAAVPLPKVAVAEVLRPRAIVAAAVVLERQPPAAAADPVALERPQEQVLLSAQE